MSRTARLFIVEFGGEFENTVNVYEPSQSLNMEGGRLESYPPSPPPPSQIRHARDAPQALFPSLRLSKQPIASLAPHLPHSIQLPRYSTVGDLATARTDQFTDEVFNSAMFFFASITLVIIIVLYINLHIPPFETRTD